MRLISVSALKARLSEHLGMVKNGEDIVVTDRRSPVARLVPFEPAEPPLMEGKAVAPFAAVRITRPRSEIDAQAMLDGERGDR